MRRSPPASIQGAPVLVLTRRANQSIMIGHDVVVTVLEVRGDQVRLGIRAPRSVEVHREEVFEEVSRPARPAAAPGDGAAGPPGPDPDPPDPPGER
jgi:carbon storage regulator